MWNVDYGAMKICGLQNSAPIQDVWGHQNHSKPITAKIKASLTLYDSLTPLQKYPANLLIRGTHHPWGHALVTSKRELIPPV